MLRRTIVAVIALVLAAGLTTAVSTVAAAPASAAYDNSIGIVKVPNQRWKGDCGKYRLRWDFNPPNSDWTVIVKIRTPRGFTIRNEFWDAGHPGKLGDEQGRLRFPLCGSSVKPGRYKVEMQMLYEEGRDLVTKNRRPTYFRLIRR